MSKMFLSNNPSSGDLNSSNLSCFKVDKSLNLIDINNCISMHNDKSILSVSC